MATTFFGLFLRHLVLVLLSVVRVDSLFLSPKSSEHLPQAHRHTTFMKSVAPYESSQLLAVTPLTDDQLSILEDLVHGPPTIHLMTDLITKNMSAQLMLPRDQAAATQSKLRDAGMSPVVIFENVAQQLQDEHDHNVKKHTQSIVGTYPDLQELYKWCDNLPSQYSFVDVSSVGKSYEHRDIKLVKIAKRPGLPIVLIECGIHAREWVSVGTCVWSINHLLTSSDPSVQSLVESLEFQFIPSANPDGYDYSHKYDRLWRKNLNPNWDAESKSRSKLDPSRRYECMGVDLNRNWGGPKWFAKGHRMDEPCNELYFGEKPFSEPETQALAKHMMMQKERIKAYLPLHAYGKLWLLPTGTGSKPPDFERLVKVGQGAVDKIKQMSGTTWKMGAMYEVYYQAAGIAIDWAHDPVNGPGIKYTFSPELAPHQDDYLIHFELPVERLPNAARDAFVGIKHVAEVVMLESSSTDK